jgi:hypothetical protein
MFAATLLWTTARQTRVKQCANIVDLVFWVLQDGGAFDRLILFSGAVYYGNVSVTPVLLIITATILIKIYRIFHCSCSVLKGENERLLLSASVCLASALQRTLSSSAHYGLFYVTGRKNKYLRSKHSAWLCPLPSYTTALLVSRAWMFMAWKLRKYVCKYALKSRRI